MIITRTPWWFLFGRRLFFYWVLNKDIGFWVMPFYSVIMLLLLYVVVVEALRIMLGVCVYQCQLRVRQDIKIS